MGACDKVTRAGFADSGVAGPGAPPRRLGIFGRARDRGARAEALEVAGLQAALSGRRLGRLRRGLRRRLPHGAAPALSGRHNRVSAGAYRRGGDIPRPHFEVFPVRIAAPLSALSFAVLHPHPLVALMYAVALTLAYLGGGLAAPIAMHAANNLTWALIYL
ncbi:MAG: CPBP family intramembrane metalloprotease, partial [Thermoproteus sp.]|nr:CPBP family intramembrane metalloprotease [Thermoproteus sp.]